MPITFIAQDALAERPLELLYACHDKVRHFVGLIAQLAPHTARHGSDSEAQQAAANVLRYFELALPHHHADEEEDIFPALRSLHEPALNAAMDAVLAEHQVLDGLWQEVRPWLNRIAQGSPPEAVPAGLAQFVSAYLAHAAREESDIFSAIERLPEVEVAQLGQRMRQRRGALS